MNRPRHTMVACLILALTLTVFSGCIAPGGLENLEVTVKLDEDEFERIEGLSGTISIENTGNTETAGLVLHCPSFSIIRKSDGMNLSVQCLVESDPSLRKHSFAPGETLNRSISFAESPYQRNWKNHAHEFPPGRYGLSVHALWGEDRSEIVPFRIIEDT